MKVFHVAVDFFASVRFQLFKFLAFTAVSKRWCFYIKRRTSLDFERDTGKQVS